MPTVMCLTPEEQLEYLQQKKRIKELEKKESWLEERNCFLAAQLSRAYREGMMRAAEIAMSEYCGADAAYAIRAEAEKGN